MNTRITDLHVSHYTVTGLENEIKKIEKNVEEWKEELERLSKEEPKMSSFVDYYRYLSDKNKKDLYTLRLKHLIAESTYKINIYRNEIFMVEANDKLQKGKISKTEYNRIIRNSQNRRKKCTEMLKASGVALDIYSNWNPNRYEDLLSAYKLIQAIFLFKSLIEKSNLSERDSENKQLFDIIKGVEGCIDIFNNTINKASDSKRRDIVRASNYAAKHKNNQLAQTISDSKSYINIRSQLSDLYHRDENIMYNKISNFSSTGINGSLDKYPSKHRFDTVRERSSHDKFDRERFKFEYEKILRNNDIIDALLPLLAMLPYSFMDASLGTTINFTEYNTAIRNLKNKLIQIKSQNIEKLKVFSELEEKYKQEDRIAVVTNILADMYKKGEPKSAIDAYKEELIKEFGESKVVIIDSNARDLHSLKNTEKEIDKMDKYEKERREESRRKFIQRDHIIPAEDLNHIKLKAKIEADKEFPNEVYLGGEYRDDPRKEPKYQDEVSRGKEAYLDRKFKDLEEQKNKKEEAEKIKQQQEADKVEKAAIEEADNIASSRGLNEEMLDFSASILNRNCMIRSSKYTELSSEERMMVIEYVAKLKSLVGKSEEEVAEEMAKDPYINPYERNNKVHQIDAPKTPDIIAQKFINGNHNVYYFINQLFGDNKHKK